MKKLIILLMMSLFIFSCEKEKIIIPPPLFFEANQWDLYLGYSEGSKTEIQVKSNTDWQIIPGSFWIKVYPSRGKGDQIVTVVAQKNNSYLFRNCELVLETNATINRHFSVYQEQGIRPNDPKPPVEM